jgi:dolichol-phosphate mannosyltransferase
MGKPLVIIPTYNEIENITNIIREILSFEREIDILIVDDNSPDGTGQEADRLATIHPQVNVLHRPAKMGLGKAYIDGFKWGLERNYEYLCEMDADFSHNPKDLFRLIDHMGRCDVCVGSRYIENAGVINWPIWREILSKSASFFVRVVTGMPVYDTTAGFKCFKNTVLRSISLDSIHSDGYSFQIEMHYKAWKAGFKILEIPIIFADRYAGRSKISRRIVIEAFFIVWKLRWLKK